MVAKMKKAPGWAVPGEFWHPPTILQGPITKLGTAKGFSNLNLMWENSYLCSQVYKYCLDGWQCEYGGGWSRLSIPRHWMRQREKQKGQCWAKTELSFWDNTFDKYCPMPCESSSGLAVSARVQHCMSRGYGNGEQWFGFTAQLVEGVWTKYMQATPRWPQLTAEVEKIDLFHHLTGWRIPKSKRDT